MNRTATAVRRAPWRAVEAGAKDAKMVAQLRGGRMKGRRLGARYDLTGTATEPTATVRAMPPHLWKWKSEGTKPHIITSKHGGGSRKSRAKDVTVAGLLGALSGSRQPTGWSRGGRRAVLNVPGIGYRRYVRHPGTPGDQSWDEVVQVVLRRAPDKIANYWLNESIRKTLG